jgi:hypothetical protein
MVIIDSDYSGDNLGGDPQEESNAQVRHSAPVGVPVVGIPELLAVL